MIPTFILNIVLTFFNVLLSFLPTWTLWPDVVHRACVRVGEYSYWLNAWINMRTFWEIVIFFDIPFFFGLLTACIFSRSLRIKIFHR